MAEENSSTYGNLEEKRQEKQRGRHWEEKYCSKSYLTDPHSKVTYINVLGVSQTIQGDSSYHTQLHSTELINQLICICCRYHSNIIPATFVNNFVQMMSINASSCRMCYESSFLVCSILIGSSHTLCQRRLIESALYSCMCNFIKQEVNPHDILNSLNDE